MKREEEIQAESKEQRAESRGQRAESRGQRTKAKSVESSCWHWALVTGHWALVTGKQEQESVLSIAPEKLGQAVDFNIAVDFSQRNREHDINSGLQPHSMWLKPVFDCYYSVRQLKQTACPDCSGAKDRVQSSEFKVQSLKKLNIKAVSIAVDFLPVRQAGSQRIKENTKREENIEYRISNNESGSCASKDVSHFLFLIPYFLFLISMRLAVQNRLAPCDEANNLSIRQFDSLERFSTVYQITKPSATGTSCSAEGCISESQAIRAA